MLYQHHINTCLAAEIGQGGLEQGELDRLLEAAARAVDQIKAAHDDGSLPLLRLPARSDDIERIEPIAERYCESFDDVVVLGTGGSSLGGRTLCDLAPLSPARPRLHFFDNIDPDSFTRLFQAIDPARTGFIVISKSGGTAETLTQFLYCLDVFRGALGVDVVGGHFTVITEPEDNPLRALATSWGLETLDHDPNIGGRFSALSVVGLLPAMIAGVDGEAVRQGAATVLDPILKEQATAGYAPAIGAAVNVGLAQSGKVNATVVMPYLDRLATFGLWFRQLWAESLGKDGHGTTPINALGAIDQHSQLQLYLDGPADKMFTLIMAKQSNGAVVPEDLVGDERLAYLAGRSMGELLDAEQRATAATLIENGRPTRTIWIDHLDDATIGALMMHFMIETIIAAQLLGVDAFDQPAVEQGKILARQYLAEGHSP